MVVSSHPSSPPHLILLLSFSSLLTRHSNTSTPQHSPAQVPETGCADATAWMWLKVQQALHMVAVLYNSLIHGSNNRAIVGDDAAIAADAAAAS